MNAESKDDSRWNSGNIHNADEPTLLIQMGLGEVGERKTIAALKR